jgi:photosystem II stability/assembly factor-like uncharacterized protein
MKKIVQVLSLALGTFTLISCGMGDSTDNGGGGDDGNKTIYKLNMSYSNIAIADKNGNIQFPVQVKNYSNAAMNGVTYSITPKYSSNNLNAKAIKLGDGSGCETLSAGQTCKFNAQVSGTPGQVYSVNWSYNGKSSGTTSNVSVIDTPDNSETGIEAINLYYPQAAVQNPDGTSSIIVLAYMSNGVYAKDSPTNFSKIKFTDTSGNDLNAIALSGNNSGDNNFVGGEAVTFLLTAPKGATVLNYKIQTLNSDGTPVQNSDEKAINIVTNDDPRGLLNISPSTLSLDENKSEQTIFLQNIGNGTVGGLDIKPTDPSKITIQSNNCPASLLVGASCQYSVKLNLSAVKLTKGSTSITANYTDAPAAANIIVKYRGQDATAGLQIKNIDGDNPDMFDFTYDNGPEMKAIRITNTGDNTETFSDVSLPEGFYLQAPYGDDNACPMPLAGNTLEPSASCDTEIVYASSKPTEGKQNGNLLISYTFPSTGGTTASTTSSVVLSYETLPPRGLLRITPVDEDNIGQFDTIFGNNKESDVKVFTVTNIGINTASGIQPKGLTAPFSGTNSCGATLNVGESCAYAIKFGPYMNSSESVVTFKQPFTIDYIPYLGEKSISTGITLAGQALPPKSAKLTASVNITAKSGFAGGSGTKTDQLQIMQGKTGGTVTYTITNTGTMNASSVYLNTADLPNSWKLDPATTCGTSSKNTINLALGATCNAIFDVNTANGTGEQALDLSNVEANWKDDASPSGTKASLTGANITYANVYAMANLTLQSKNPVKVVQGDRGTEITWNLLGGYNESDTATFASLLGSNISIEPTTCAVTSSNPTCTVKVLANTSAPLDLSESVISVSITGEATTTPRNVSVNVFKPTNFLVGGDNGTINVVDQNQEISNIVYPKVGFQAVAKSGNRYVAVGESGAIITSTDGVNWKAVNSGTTNALFSVAYGSGTFIAAGNNVILKSTNGINWNIVKSDTSSAIWVIKDMLYDSNNSSWIATGVNCRNSSNNNLDTCMTHYDYDNKDSLVLTAPQSGTGWTMRNLSTKGGIMSSVIKNGTTYILTSNGGEAIISMSNDAGLNWVQFSSIPLSSSVSCSFLQSKNGGSLCSGISFVDNTLVFLWANYSSRMYKVNMDNGNPTQLQGYFPTNIAIGITCNGATCVSPVDAIYKNYSYIKSNIDLVNNRFTATEGNNIGDKQPMNSALIIDGNLWMTGTKGVVVSSPNNGNTWIGEQNPMAGNVNGIAFNGSNTFVAVANGGNILKSTDRGNTWTTIPAPSNANLYSVAYGNGTFIAVGASVILSSRDGITWSSATPNGLNVDLRSVNYSNFGFTAVGASGNVWNSTTNGASWTQKTKNGNTYGSSTLFASIAKNNTNVIGGTTSLYSGADLNNLNNYSSVVAGTTVKGITYGDMFYASGYNSAGENFIFRSVDAQKNWTKLPTTGLLNGGVYGMSYAGGTLIAVGQNTVAFSDDGIEWKSLDLTNNIFGQSYYTAVGYDANVSRNQ